MPFTPDRTLNQPALDAKLSALHEKRTEWARLSLDRKIQYLRGIVKKTVSVSDRWVSAAVAAKKIDAKSPVVGEEWIGGPVCVVRIASQFASTLREIRKAGTPKIARKLVVPRPDGRGVRVKAFPGTLLDRFTFLGFTAECWMETGVTADNLLTHTATFYQQKDPEGAVSLILGAGNVSSIAPLDLMHKLYMEGKVSIVKMNPVNDYLGEFFEEIFSELISDGYVAISYGAADVGSYLCQHALIDDIHITGSVATHNAIVFGPGPEGETRRQKNDPILQKRITSELGNVSPIIVVPGKWSKSDIAFHAENIASMLVNNGGFNCNAAKVLIMPADWSQKDPLMQAVVAVLKSAHQREAYYPGAHDRYNKFKNAHHDAIVCGEDSQSPSVVPWTIFPNLDPSDRSELCFREEAFCGLVGQTALPSTDTAEYLRNAVKFANETLYGTLSASIVCHPSTEKALGPVFHEAIAGLRYGSVGINHWTALCYAFGQTGWGAFPGHTLNDVQSGIGMVHNTKMFDKLEKNVVRGPFRPMLKPAWFASHRQTGKMGPALLKLEASKSYGRLMPLVFLALRG